MNLLILGDNRSQSVKYLEQEARKKGHTVSVNLPSEYAFEVSESEKGYDKIWKQSPPKDGELLPTNKRIYKHDVDAVILKMGGSNYSLFVLRQFQNLGIAVYNEPTAFQICGSKMRTHQVLSRYKGINNVTTLMVSKATDLQWIAERVGFPFVIKENKGSQGGSVYIVENKTQLNQLFRLISEDSIIQEYVNTKDDNAKSSDIRAYVVGEKVVASFKRYSMPDDFRSNYSISKQGAPIELDDSEKEMAIRACKAVGCDWAGVDIIRKPVESNQYKSLIVEVNSNASLNGITAVTKVNVAKYMIEHVENTYQESKKQLSTAQTLELKNLDLGQNVPSQGYYSLEEQRAIRKLDLFLGKLFFGSR